MTHSVGTAPYCDEGKRPLWRARAPTPSGAHAATTFAGLKETILNLGVNSVEPLLRSVGLLSIGRAFSFQFCNPIFGCAQLIRELLSHGQRATAVLFSNASSLVN